MVQTKERSLKLAQANRVQTSPAQLETERLRIRPFALSDASFIVEHFNEVSFIRNIADKGVRNLEDAENYLRTGPIAMYQQLGIGLCAIELVEGNRASGDGSIKSGRLVEKGETVKTGKLIGTCGLLKRDCLPDMDVGYSLMKKYWGRGYASEAVSVVLHDAFTRLVLKKVLAVVNPNNSASIRLLRKQLFERCGEVQLADSAQVIDVMKLECSQWRANQDV